MRAALRVSSLFNHPLAEQETREASLGAFFNFPDNLDTVAGISINFSEANQPIALIRHRTSPTALAWGD